MDLWGLTRTTGRGGYRFTANFIDAYSRITAVFPLKSKDNALGAFKQFHGVFQALGYKILSTLSDNGGEFKNDPFKDYTTHWGITMNFSAPYHTQSQGMAERTNQTLPGMTRCLLLEAKLPNWYWPDAITHACYIKNRIPHSAHKKTPYELF